MLKKFYRGGVRHTILCMMYCIKKLFIVALIVCLGFAALSAAACKPEKREGLTSYGLVAVYDEENRTLTGTAEVDFFNSSDNEICDLKFNLYGNAFREGSAFPPVPKSCESRAYYAGKNYGGMQITEVEGCAGWDVTGEDENILVVNLLQPVYPEQRAQIKISYVLQLARVNHRTGVTQNCVNLGNFYPTLCAYSPDGFVECPYYSCGDPFLSEVADYTVELDVPEGYLAAASGQKTFESTADGRLKTRYILQKARDFAIVLSKNFKVLEREVDGVGISYYYTSDDCAESNFSAACESFGYFNGLFGRYAYPTLSVVQTGFCYGGMEYPALTMIAEGLSADDGAYTVVHENAHQWWYAMVGSNQLSCAWQDEGLAEYSSLMFFENSPKYGFTRAGLVGEATRAYRAYFSVFNQLNGKADTTMSRNLSAFSGEYEYVNVTYNKGLLLFDCLRNAMGDDKFTAALKKYCADYTFKIASEEDVTAVFSANYKDAESIFSAFTEGKILI